MRVLLPFVRVTVLGIDVYLEMTLVKDPSLEEHRRKTLSTDLPGLTGSRV